MLSAHTKPISNIIYLGHYVLRVDLALLSEWTEKLHLWHTITNMLLNVGELATKQDYYSKTVACL